MQQRIPFLNLGPAHDLVKEEMLAAFREVYDSNWFILGDRLKDFEAAYAKFNGVNHAIGVSNGLDALFLALKALGVGPGDEVIVPSNTYIATVLAVLHAGAKPVFAEPDINTYNITAAAMERVISGATKAVIPVHLFGQACEMDQVVSLSQRHKFHIIEDNAQAHGAAFNGRSTGSWGVINATSFYPGKNLGALGDGGAVTTNDSGLADKVRILRNYGSEKKYYHEAPGYNMRLDELQAAFLTVKLKCLEEWTMQRQQIAAWYHEMLQHTGDMILPFVAPGAAHVYHLYVVRTKSRDALCAHLSAHGVGTLIHYPVPPYRQAALQGMGCAAGAFPVADELAATSLSLPVWPGMRQEDAAFIAHVIKQFFHG